MGKEMKHNHKTCKEYEEQILIYDELEKALQDELDRHMEDCENCRSLFQAMRLLISAEPASKATQHPGTDLLSRYVVQNRYPGEPDYDGTSLSKAEAAFIKDHLANCTDCSKRVEEMTLELNEIAEYVQEAGVPDLTIAKRSYFGFFPSDILERIREFFKEPLWGAPRYIPALATLSLALLISIFALRTPGTSDQLFRLSRLDAVSLGQVTRAQNNPLLSNAFETFNKRDFLKSAEQFENYLSTAAEDAQTAYLHYSCALAYLSQANQTLSQPLSGENRQWIQQAIEHLNQSLQDNPSRRVLENDYWYLGKAFLMLSDADMALSYFKKITVRKGRRARAAEEIIAVLEK